MEPPDDAQHIVRLGQKRTAGGGNTARARTSARTALATMTTERRCIAISAGGPDDGKHLHRAPSGAVMVESKEWLEARAEEIEILREKEGRGVEYEKIDWEKLDKNAPAYDLSSALTKQMGRETAKAFDQGFQAAAGMDTTKKIEELLIELRTLRADRESSPDDIRNLGWCVAVHNDYHVHGEHYTFWLFTKNGRAVKGEGRTDTIALRHVRAAIVAAKKPDAD